MEIGRGVRGMLPRENFDSQKSCEQMFFICFMALFVLNGFCKILDNVKSHIVKTMVLTLRNGR